MLDCDSKGGRAALPIHTTHWLAGILEGEGSFMVGSPSTPRMSKIALRMSDQDVVEKVAKILGVAVTKNLPRQAHYKPMFQLKLAGKRAVEWMLVLRPLMGLRRQGQIDVAIKAYYDRQTGRVKLKDDDLEQIRTLLSQKQTHTSIAARFGVTRSHISHIASGRSGRSTRLPNHVSVV